MRQRDFYGYTWDPDEEKDLFLQHNPGERCTPARLLDFIRESHRLHGRMPTLGELKDKFGGVLGAFCDYWELGRRGLIKNGRLVEDGK